VNVCTIEDPIEMIERSSTRCRCSTHIDLDFAAGVRTLMRQDPDIIMIGEIRDLETAEMAVQASLTGHLVLSTLHTNDAPSAVTRLLDLGVPHYLLLDPQWRAGAAPGAHAVPALQASRSCVACSMPTWTWPASAPVRVPRACARCAGPRWKKWPRASPRSRKCAPCCRRANDRPAVEAGMRRRSNRAT
jgi:hypothetical protein